MTTDKLGSRMNNNVCSVLNRTYNIRCTEGIVHDKRYVMAMCHLCHSLKIVDVRVRIAKCFCIHYLGIGLDGSLKSLKVVYVDNGIGYILSGEGMCNEVERTSI